MCPREGETPIAFLIILFSISIVLLFYCLKTYNISTVCFLECSFYKVLDNLDRSQGYIGIGKCDRSLLKGWYRFQRQAGKQMSQSCVPKQRCGTDAPGWLAEGHPKKSDGAVKRKVCFHWSYSCCRFSSYIRVRNCGAFYVYELDSTRFCSLRYCGDGM